MFSMGCLLGDGACCRNLFLSLRDGKDFWVDRELR